MGAQGSTLRGLISSTDGVAYSTRRKHAAKELQAATKALGDAATAYADALKGAGSSLVVFCAGTSLYAGTSLGGDVSGGDASQASSSHAVPQSGPLLPAYGASSSGGPQTDASGTSAPPQVSELGKGSAVSTEEEYPDGKPPVLGAEQERGETLATQEESAGTHDGLTQQDRAFFSANDIPLPPSQPADSPDSSALPEAVASAQAPMPAQPQTPMPLQIEPQQSQPPEAKPWETEATPHEHMSMQLAAPKSGPVLGDKALDQYAKQLNDLFLEAAALTAPLIEALGAGIPVEKTSTPSLSSSSARGLDGKLEPLGQTLQKLVNWERKLKEDIKVVDAHQHELRRKDKKLEKQATRLLKRSTKDTQKVDDARARVNDVTARLAATSASLENTIGELEQFKSDLLLQQVLRLLPLFASLWQLSAEIFTKQQQLALQLSMQEPPQVTRSNSLSLAFRATDVSGPLTSVPEASATAAPGAAAGAAGYNGGPGAGAGAGAGAGVPASGPLPGPPGRGQGPPLTRSKSAFARAIGVAFSGTTKAQHEATKKLEDAFKGLNTAKSALNKAQKGFCTSLMMWASKTKALPPSFPKPTPRTLVPVQEQLPSQLPMEQQMQLMVHRGDVYTALPNDWIRMLDSLPDGELQGAISGFCGWLSQAYNLQKQEMKASKRVLEATRLLTKVEQKLAEKQQREHELRLVLARSGELLAGHEREYQVKEQQLVAASNDVASAKAMVEAARDRDAKERIGLERLIAGGKVAVAAALQRRLAVVFQQASTYATTASHGFSSLHKQHAPWLSESPSAPVPNMNPAPAPPSVQTPNVNIARAPASAATPNMMNPAVAA